MFQEFVMHFRSVKSTTLKVPRYSRTLASIMRTPFYTIYLSSALISSTFWSSIFQNSWPMSSRFAKFTHFSKRSWKSARWKCRTLSRTLSETGKTNSNQERVRFSDENESFHRKTALRKDRTAGLFLWLFLNCDHPYPSESSNTLFKAFSSFISEEKTALAAKCGLSKSQVQNWLR